MKKLMIAFAAIAAFVSVASATDWFTGTIGSEAGGSWTMTPGDDGEITTNNTTLVLEDAAASFVATTPKALSGSANLNFATSAKFAYSYDELPTVDSSAKAGVVVFDSKYYVLEKDGNASPATNKWVSTDITATLDSPVDVAVSITNGTDGAHALYKFGNSTAIDKLVVASGNWGAVDYKGSGEVASLVGTTISLGYPIPHGDPIPTDVGNEWAEEHGITPDKIAEVLASTQTFKGGRTAAESCLLGVGTNDDVVAVINDTKPAKLELAVGCTPVAGRATFTLKKDGDVVVSGQGSASFEYDLSDGVYTVVANVDGASKELLVSQEIGVKGTSVVASTVYFIGAPWDDCAITNLFKKSCCAEGDKVEVYDAASDEYKTWTLTSGAWVYAETGEAPSIKKGQAVKYTTAAGTTEGAKLWQVGNVSEENTTPIVKGKWNLVAYPDGEIDATKLPLEAAVDQAIVLNGITTTAIYTKFGEDVYKKDGYNAAWSKDSIGNVSGGFFLKTKQNELVAWPAKQSK